MATPGAPLDHTRQGEILRGEKTWDLDQYALTDRIINIRFTRRSGEVFTVRSDYEVHISQSGEPYFIPVRQKPSIRVSYKQVSQGTAIQVLIKVDNLFIQAEHNLFINSNDPVIQADIQMGYRKQFPDWTKPPLSFDSKESGDPEHAQNRLKLFYSLAGFQETGTLEAMDTGLVISVQVLATYNENLPPDRTTVFQGIIGTMDYGFRWNNRGDIADYFNTASNFPLMNREGEELSFLEKVFWFYITSRFIRPGITHRFYSSDADRLLDGAGGSPYDVGRTDRINRVDVLDYDKDATPRRFFPADEQVGKPLEGPGGRWVQLDISNLGILPIEDAAALGVVVITTKRVREVANALYTPKTVPGGAFDRQSFSYIQAQDTEGAQMRHIQQAHFPFIRWVLLNNGDYFVYHVDETIEHIREAITERGERHTRPLLLPAIYDITISGVRTIRCPFISFVSPGQDVGFNSRYTISDMVGFFYPASNDAWFTVVRAEVEFATVDDVNMMALMCVDAKTPPHGTTLSQDETRAEGGVEDEAAEEEREEAIEAVVRWKRQSIGQWVTRETAGRVGAGKITMWTDFAEVAVLKNSAFDFVEDVPRYTGKWGKDIAAAINWLLDTDTGEGETNRDICKNLLKEGRPKATGYEWLGELGVVDPYLVAQLNEFEDVWYIPFVSVKDEG